MTSETISPFPRGASPMQRRRGQSLTNTASARPHVTGPATKTMKTKPTTIEDIEHKMRAQLVQLYEAACMIDYPRGSDTAFRDALQARLSQGCAAPAREHAVDEEALIRAAQNVRLYKASAAIRNPDAAALAFRLALQKTLGVHFRLQEAVRAATATAPKGGRP
jgi:hypothetical protein